MTIAVVGATGLVGTEILRVLEQSNIKITNLIPVASENSVGKTIVFNNQALEIVSIDSAIAQKPNIALFSFGGSNALKYAPLFAEQGTIVIDNSSAWRMDKNVPLIVPEINAASIKKTDKIIANPNCSTIQMVMVLNPLHQKYQIKRVVVSTYQSVTGTGVKAVEQLKNEMLQDASKGTYNIANEAAYNYPIHKNCIPHIDVFLENGYTKEEMKMILETQKILNDATLKIAPTAVRVPTIGGHAESVNITFKNPYELNDIRTLLAATTGIIVQDDVQNNIYPMPWQTQGKNEVFVGRIRRDDSEVNALNLWIVADNLRKGAATNAVQIAAYVINNIL